MLLRSVSLFFGDPTLPGGIAVLDSRFRTKRRANVSD